MGLISSISKGVGSILNNITGQSNSAKQAQNYTQQNMAMSQGMTLEQMQKSHEYYMQQLAQNYAYEINSAKNAIQWQMQDLKNAGLNPILAAGYGGANLGGAVGASGASGGASAPSGSTGSASANPLDLIQSIASAKNTIANAKLADNQAILTGKQAGLYNDKTMQEIAESKSRIAANQANSAQAYANAKYTSGAQTKNTEQKTNESKGTKESLTNEALTYLFDFLGGK